MVDERPNLQVNLVDLSSIFGDKAHHIYRLEILPAEAGIGWSTYLQYGGSKIAPGGNPLPEHC